MCVCVCVCVYVVYIVLSFANFNCYARYKQCYKYSLPRTADSPPPHATTRQPCPSRPLTPPSHSTIRPRSQYEATHTQKIQNKSNIKSNKSNRYIIYQQGKTKMCEFWLGLEEPPTTLPRGWWPSCISAQIRVIREEIPDGYHP